MFHNQKAELEFKPKATSKPLFSDTTLWLLSQIQHVTPIQLPESIRKEEVFLEYFTITQDFKLRQIL